MAKARPGLREVAGFDISRSSPSEGNVELSALNSPRHLRFTRLVASAIVHRSFMEARRLMIDTLHLKKPMQTFYEAYREAIGTVHRPLTEKDYYEACHHPKDHKRSNDALYAGLSYVARHMKRNWKAGLKYKAAG